MKNILKKIFNKKKGVTILEGLIALGLLALVAAGTFGVLLSVSRQSTSPDIREEMVWAVERAHSQLQMYSYSSDFGLGSRSLSPSFPNGLCGNASGGDLVTDSDPLGPGDHSIRCMLPAICDRNTSNFYYTVTDRLVNVTKNSYYQPYGGSGMGGGYGYDMVGMVSGAGYRAIAPMKTIDFTITCNGFTL